MASLISCPHCGVRPKEEFTIRGDASLARPTGDADAGVWYDYVYLRDNPKGRHKEYWHHSSGCRRWLIVERDTVSHAVHTVSDAALAKLGGAA
ncbi:sarcosine oxidase subunit delta [Rhizobium viscosum]|uniref:Sarcosine oxidase subunit delta n=1 Tax=Rhizobium viscosum TaxID=1673 RepID=A0ABR9IWI2_RHIVS|nr:sarcosine oxidase subunit delta [Rhizobium viscosum]MBE1507569.1 sarcosine oxidase subunit delta [Rhizobium viscosum]